MPVSSSLQQPLSVPWENARRCRTLLSDANKTFMSKVPLPLTHLDVAIYSHRFAVEAARAEKKDKHPSMHTRTIHANIHPNMDGQSV